MPLVTVLLCAVRNAADLTPQRPALRLLPFCLFAEDIGLFPPRLFSVLLQRTRRRPADFKARLAQLFAAIAAGVAKAKVHALGETWWARVAANLQNRFALNQYRTGDCIYRRWVVCYQ